MDRNPAFASVPAQENSLRVVPSGFRGGGEVDGPDGSNGKEQETSKRMLPVSLRATNMPYFLPLKRQKFCEDGQIAGFTKDILSDSWENAGFFSECCERAQE
jgi:hypothetical protein